jgi:amidase
VELGVVGPLARSAEDLALALGVLAGPDGEDAKGYSLSLPSPRFGTAADLRVLIVDVHPLAHTDEVIRAAVEAAGEALETEGARVTRSLKRARLPNFEESHGIYSAMLGAIFSRGRPGRVPVMDAHAWMDLLAAQHRVRRAWAEVFTEVDVVLAPAFGAPAFPHVTEEDWSRRTLTINGAPTPYSAATAWAGLASLANLPATCAPAARTTEGLPLGVQVIGAFLDDRTTIAVGGLVSALTVG